MKEESLGNVIFFVLYYVHLISGNHLHSINFFLGVGADDTFIMVKSWRMFQHCKPDPGNVNDDDMTVIVRKTLQNSVTTMLVTSLTTAAAFFTSSVSSITAIKCFR